MSGASHLLLRRRGQAPGPAETGPDAQAQGRLRAVQAHAVAPRPDVLLGDAQPARRGPPRRARALRLPARRRPDRRRPAPRPPRPSSAAARSTSGRPSSSAAARARLLRPPGDRRGRRRGHPATSCRCRSWRSTWTRCASTAGPVRLETREDLDRYMRGSAGAVGLLMAPLLGAPCAAARCEVASLGVAFQLTNFIRDVREDYALDRVYLPEEDRARFGVSERDIAAAAGDAGLPRAARARGRTGARRCSRRPPGCPTRCSPGVRPGIRLALQRLRGRARPCRVARLRRAAPACGAAAVALRRRSRCGR